MKKQTIKRLILLTMLLALCLGLSSCYVPPDEISGDNNLTVGSNNLPFSSLAPSPTPTPTVTPTPVPQSQGGTVTVATATPGINWTWNNTPSPTPVTGGVSNTGGITVVTQAPTPTPTVTPTPNSLQRGFTGSEVRALQQRLKDLGYYNGSVDGSFGPGTENAVKAFQQANGLTVDGKAGKNTLNRLNSSNAIPFSAVQGGTSNYPVISVTSAPTATPDLSKARYLQEGYSGSDVRRLQQRLIDLGWMAGQADGTFGASTTAAVKAFQKQCSLWDDGIAGPETQARLYAANAPKANRPASSTGESLREGAQGEAVRALQRQLKNLGYYSGSIDGSYGAGTTAAVLAFQQANGLKADGVAGTQTLNKIYSVDAVPYTTGSNFSSTNSSNTVSSTGYTTLQQGDQGEGVRRLQQRLKNLGFYSGSVDGSYGAGTVAAVQAFQSMNNLRVDGKAGPATQRALYGSNASSASSHYETIRPNDEGISVTNLQYTLYELGYFDDTVNGIYRSTTSDAVRAFQIANGITPVDGIAGNKTLQALYSPSAIAASAQPTTFETLRPGAKGDEVVQLQDSLQQLGYLYGVTGVYDDATRNAVMNFQTRNGLSADGIAGSSTLSLLYYGNPKRAN